MRLREDRILDEARLILVEEGYGALKMDRLAERIEYSRGTVYGHFENRADILAALVTRSIERRTALMSIVCGFEGTPRECVLAKLIVVARSLQASGSIVCMLGQMVFDTGMIEKARPRRRQQLADARKQLFDMIGQPAQRAIEAGDLPDDPTLSANAIGFLIWSIFRGTGTVLCDRSGMWNQRLPDIHSVALGGLHALLDGLGWKPLSGDWDYDDSLRRIEAWIDTEIGDTRLNGQLATG